MCVCVFARAYLSFLFLSCSVDSIALKKIVFFKWENKKLVEYVVAMGLHCSPVDFLLSSLFAHFVLLYSIFCLTLINCYGIPVNGGLSHSTDWCHATVLLSCGGATSQHTSKHTHTYICTRLIKFSSRFSAKRCLRIDTVLHTNYKHLLSVTGYRNPNNSIKCPCARNHHSICYSIQFPRSLSSTTFSPISFS